MANKTYTELYGLITALAGVSDFTTSEQTNILAFVNRRLYQAYRTSPMWPRYVVSAQARPATSNVIADSYTGSSINITSAIRSGTTVTVVCATAVDFVAGMFVTTASLSGTVDPNGSYQVVGIDTTTVKNDTFTYTLDTTNTATETYTGSGTVIADTIPDIDSYNRIWGANPFNLYSANEYEFYVDSSGAHVVGNTTGLTGFWVAFTKQWGGDYTTSSTDIPLEFFHYAAHASYADFLRMDGQTDKAAMEEQVAQQYLMLELEKAEHQRNSNLVARRISTYVSRSTR
jgi:hypothetical protein